MSQTKAGILALVLMLMGLVLGGGTRNSLMTDLCVQLFAGIVLVWALRHLSWETTPAPTRQFLCLLGAVLVLPLLQLLPLPAGLNLITPGREGLYAGRTAFDLEIPSWLPWSLDPTATLAAFRSLLPAAALALVGSQLNTVWLHRLTLVVVSVAVLMVPLGITQVAQGPHSDLRPYQPTNIHDAVGLFANRNHYASLLATALALAMAHLVRAGRLPGMASTATLRRIGWMIAGAMLLLGIVLSRSRGGVVLAGIALLTWVAVVFAQRRHDRQTFRWLLSFVVIGGVLAFQFGFLAIADRLNQKGDTRAEVFSDVMAVSSQFGWLGSGVGSFQSAYAAHEPLDLVGSRILTHAHNDWAELWVELGILMMPAVVLFGIWFWQRVLDLRGRARQQPLQIASLLVIVMLCLHSAVDYPLRTTAVSMVFVLACLLCSRPIETSSGADSAHPKRYSHAH